MSLSREDEKERRGRREGVRARGGEKVGWARREERDLGRREVGRWRIRFGGRWAAGLLG
jgi:hypothetical protein